VENSEDAIVLFDPDRKVLYANGVFFSTFKTTSEQVMGLGYLEILRAELGSDAELVDQILDRGETCSFHGVFFEMKQTGAKAGPFCVSCNKLDLDGDAVTTVVFKDMTPVAQYIDKVKQVGEVLEKERDYLNMILDGIADGYYVTDLNGRIVRTNAKLLDMLGKEHDEVAGKQCRDVLCSDHCETDCPLTWVSEHQIPILQAQEAVSGKNGERIPIRKSTFPVRDVENRMQGLISIISNQSEIEDLKNRLSVHGMDFPLNSSSKRMQDIFQLVVSMKDTDPYVLITGESGTGKEVLANSIVQNSPRRSRPYLKINCSAMPEGLLESDLFGHKRGAFTGAVADKTGKFAMANHGTILLDEIGDMPLAIQAKVLRVLENGEFQQVGSTKTEKVDVRIIATTNQDIKTQMERNNFREDLYFRLCVVPIELLPLRERKEDISFLIRHFISLFNKKYGKRVNDVSARAFTMLVDYDWPGNIRELRNAVEHAFACIQGDIIERAHLPLHIRQLFSPELMHSELDKNDRDLADREMILRLLQKYNGNREKTAKVLRISRTTLWRKIKALGIGKFQ